MNAPTGKRTLPRLARLALAAASLTLLCSCASAYFYDQAVARKPKAFIMDSKDLDTGPALASAFDSSWIRSQTTERVAIRSADGIDLVARYLPAASPTGKLAILAHGYSADCWSMGSIARFYWEELGYGVLLPDARGHGESRGNYIGFGWPDRRDYMQWIRLFIDRLGPDTRVVLHGVSMGGATVLMASGERDLPPQVRAIVDDCGYTSADEELAYQLQRMYGITDRSILARTSRMAKRRAGYSFEEASALEQVKKSRTPTLFIHGGADTFVPTEMAHRLYDACASDKQLFIVPGAGHGMSFSADYEGYTARVREFLAAHGGQ
jgi:uncharacterized protein